MKWLEVKVDDISTHIWRNPDITGFAQDRKHMIFRRKNGNIFIYFGHSEDSVYGEHDLECDIDEISHVMVLEDPIEEEKNNNRGCY